MRTFLINLLKQMGYTEDEYPTSDRRARAGQYIEYEDFVMVGCPDGNTVQVEFRDEELFEMTFGGIMGDFQSREEHEEFDAKLLAETGN